MTNLGTVFGRLVGSILESKPPKKARRSFGRDLHHRKRALRFESLENRQLLSAGDEWSLPDGFLDTSSQTALVASAAPALAPSVMEGAASPSATSFPEVKAWVESCNGGSCVRYEAYDPVERKWKSSSSEPYVGNVRLESTADGVVVWTVRKLEVGPGVNRSEFGIWYAVYDPTRGRWQRDGSSVRGSSESDQVFGRFGGNSRGVVLWQSEHWNGSLRNRECVDFATYDYRKGRWVSETQHFQRIPDSSTYKFFRGPARTADGIVIWHQVELNNRHPNQHQFVGNTVGYAVYDPTLGKWQTGRSSSQIEYRGEPEIKNFTVHMARGDGHSSQAGYDSAKRRWYNGPTTPTAQFHAAPAPARPSTVWFINTSLGNHSSKWTFGDGNTSSEPVAYHTYSRVGTYKATLTVSGPGGTASVAQNVSTDVEPPTGSIDIANNAKYCTSRSVTLSLRAKDNFGAVAAMQLSNDGKDWTTWEAYAATKAWKLSKGDGTKRVYVRFRDAAGNVSRSFSDTIILDTTPPGAPVVKGGVATKDSTPTWSWTRGGGGDKTYRYKLDDSDFSAGATQTTLRSFTPNTPLSVGKHTLYVQERDAAGLWSASGSWTIEILPVPVA